MRNLIKIKLKNIARCSFKFSVLVTAINIVTGVFWLNAQTFAAEDGLKEDVVVKKGLANSKFNKPYITSNTKNQTHVCKDANNCLKHGFVMNFILTTIAEPEGTRLRDFDVLGSLRIPGYDYKNLTVFIFDKNQNRALNFQQVQLVHYDGEPTAYFYLKNLSSSTYEVHVYSREQNKLEFVCKSEFSLFSKNSLSDCHACPILDARGAPIKDNTGQNYEVAYLTPKYLQNQQFYIIVPSKLVPEMLCEVKIVFFKSGDANAVKNIDKIIYDSVSIQSASYDKDKPNRQLWFRFIPDAQFGTDSQTEYEAHFYADEVKPENFLFKARGIYSEW